MDPPNLTSGDLRVGAFSATSQAEDLSVSQAFSIGMKSADEGIRPGSPRILHILKKISKKNKRWAQGLALHVEIIRATGYVIPMPVTRHKPAAGRPQGDRP
jgi:hypothetical protein